MKYTESHEWIKVDGDVGTVGISEYALGELGEVVYVELPEIGERVAKNQEGAVLESTKAAADIYSPVSGEIIAVNMNVMEKINEAPEGEGWLFKVRLSDPAECEDLLSSDEYKKTVE